MNTVLFKRRKGTTSLKKITSRPFAQTHTEEDLHQFLESEPSLIARGIAEGDPIPTVVVGSHLNLKTGELDLLLLDAEGEITVAELKRDRTAREVIGQVLDYAAQVELLGMHGLTDQGVDWEGAIEILSQSGEAAEDLDLDRLKLGLQNPRILIVAFEVDESTKRIAEFLRARRVPIYCIEFKYFSDYEFEYYYPEVIGAEEVRRISTEDETPTQRAYRSIWEELLQDFKAKRPGVTRRSSTKDSWVSMPIGIAYAHLEWSIHGLNRKGGWFEVGFHLEHTDRDKNVDALQWLESNRSRMELLIGQELHFEEWGKRWARVYARRDAPVIDDDAKEWALDAMLRFYDLVEDLDIVEEFRDRVW
jgi:hypothetical protein